MYIINQEKNDTIFDQGCDYHAGRDYIFEEMNGLKLKNRCQIILSNKFITGA
jgi:23S rRNA (uracil1939-C5)-methyltransferase